jgi:hypothetical protein
LPKITRDPVYLAALGVLGLACVFALVLAVTTGGSSGASADTAQPGPTAAATPTAVSAVASPSPEPTPQLWETLLDARRVLDLSTLRDALISYHQRFGAYPTTGGAVVPMCTTRGDAGCALSAVNSHLSYNDGTDSYLYTSDGRTFTLITRLQTPVTSDGCGGAVPAALVGLPAYCIGPKEAS